MSRELKLKYLLELISDIGPKARKDAQAMSEAQRRIREELAKSGQEVGALERLLMRMGGVGSASLSKQADYLTKLALKYQQLQVAAERSGAAMRGTAAIVTGAGAAAWTADRLAKPLMDYETTLARLANTTFRERGVTGRIEGKRTLDTIIQGVRKQYGGTREDIAEALGTIMGKGDLPVDKSKGQTPLSVATGVLREAARVSTASGASTSGLANVGLQAMQMGIPMDKVGQALNQAYTAGEMGGFELKNMERYLPEALALARGAGLRGEEGYQRVIALMQASIKTAGTPDQAGNNVVNLLSKINSEDTANDFKKQGVDLRALLANANAKGINSLDAFMGAIDKLAARNPQYVALQKQLAATTDEGKRKEILQSQVDILEQSAVGKVVQDRQALAALVAERGNRGYVQSVMTGMQTDKTSAATSLAVMQQETAYKREQALESAKDAAQRGFQQLAPAFNTMYDAAVKLNAEYPVLTASMMALSGVVMTLTAGLGASAGIGAVLDILGGKGGAGGPLDRDSKGRFLRRGGGALLGAAGRVALPIGAAYGAYQIYELGDALHQINAVNTREGVRLSQSARERLGQIPATAYMPMTGGLTAPTAQIPGLLTQKPGALRVDVRVSDDRVTAKPSVVQQPSVVRIDAGSTNPGSYR